MSGISLFDTNAVVAYMNGDEQIADMFRNADTVNLSAIIMGELYYGAENSSKKVENLQAINELALSGITILEVTQKTAQIYGQLHKQLRSKGRPIPQNDIWIASTAMEYDLTLVTRDKHFSEVDNLKILGW